MNHQWGIISAITYRSQHLHVPAPAAYHSEFLRVCYRLLPRSVFQQYLSNEVLCIDEVY
jgi:hypothetical protein